MFFFSKKPKQTHFESLKEKWSTRHREIQENLWQKHKGSLQKLSEKSKQFVVGSLAGAVLLATPASSLSSSIPQIIKEKPFKDLDAKTTFLIDLRQYTPKEVRQLTPDEEQKIGEILSLAFNVKATAQLQGKRLNRSYGYIGQEQNLIRYPGDTIDTHFASGEEAQKFYDFGIAPGLGAYGYFANSRSSMTSQDVEREKWYIAVQTFLAPGYLEHTKQMNDFFKFHKMLVVNPENGKAVIADIGDSGPSEWTGKQLGGSPEVMTYLERFDGAQKGPVLYFFIDDPHNKVPLGPIGI